MDISSFELEKQLVGQGFDCIIGTDEVGRGPLCGPVVACAVALKNLHCHSGLDPESGMEHGGKQILKQVQDDNPMWELVRDSKKLSEKQREKVFEFIHEKFFVGIGLCNHETIDRINILEASFLAMKKSIQELMRNKEIPESYRLKTKTCVLVDGNKKIPNFSYEQRAVIGGDRISKSISAASIVAKVTRDRMMQEFAKKYPGYGMEKHMGYGTKFHMEALDRLGPCEIHRKSFAPVKKLLNG